MDKTYMDLLFQSWIPEEKMGTHTMNQDVTRNSASYGCCEEWNMELQWEVPGWGAKLGGAREDPLEKEDIWENTYMIGRISTS